MNQSTNNFSTQGEHTFTGKSLDTSLAKGATCVIYRIRNTINAKFYIGSAVSFRKRRELHLHRLRHNKHDNSHLQNAWNKYGHTVFVFEIVEDKITRKSLVEREQHYIDTLNPQYNIVRTAQRNRGLPLSEEHRRKLSIAHKNRVRRPASGWKQSAETANKLRVIYDSPEHKQKMSIKTTEYWNSLSLTERKQRSQYKKGRIFSPKTKQKLSTLKQGTTKDEATKQKIATSVKRYWETKKTGKAADLLK